MSSYPLKFEVAATAEPGVLKNWKAEVGHFQPLDCAIPKEFQGSGDGYSPEDLFALSVMNCLIATYKVLAQMTGLSFEQITSKAIITIDRIEKKAPSITNLHIYFNVYKPSDPAKAQKLFEDTKRNCMISNAVSIDKTFSFETL